MVFSVHNDVIFIDECQQKAPDDPVIYIGLVTCLDHIFWKAPDDPVTYICLVTFLDHIFWKTPDDPVIYIGLAMFLDHIFLFFELPFGLFIWGQNVSNDRSTRTRVTLQSTMKEVKLRLFNTI